MSIIFRYLSHPQVNINANIPVPKWELSSIGKARTLALKGAKELAKTSKIISSNENKAIETANILASQLKQEIIILENSHENDRSSTGFLNERQFETTATRFFAKPNSSICGWERAIDAQTRIVNIVENLINNHKNGDILMVGHGGIGTLLYCHLANIPISRKWDQAAGGGNFFSYDINSKTLLSHWQAMEKLSN